MSGFSYKTALPLVMILGLCGCQNLYVKPSAIPSGYSYHNDLYKSPPSPEPDSIGYEYSPEQNAQIQESMRAKALELFVQLENQFEMDGVDFYVYNAYRANGQSATFDHVLREIVREKGYRLSATPHGAIGLGYAFHEPEPLERRINFGDLQDDNRKTTHHERIDTYESMIVVLQLTQDTEVLGTAEGVYTVPMYGYKRDARLGLDKPVIAPPQEGNR